MTLISMSQWMLMTAIVSVSLTISKSSNPMKISWKMMMIMMTSCLMMFLCSYKSFFPMISIMIMIGGLMIMYMVMSSMMPNNPMSTSKYSSIEFISISSILIIFYKFYQKEMTMVNYNMNMKNMIMSKHMFILMMIIMLMYFYCMTYIMEKENSSMRCYH